LNQRKGSAAKPNVKQQYAFYFVSTEGIDTAITCILIY